MSNLAKGPVSGYIYQFEVALLELSKLKIKETLSVEKVDDVAKENEQGTYIFTIQAKHSISSSGKSFGNTSQDLWKTLNIWIDKLKEGVLNNQSKFIAQTNIKVPQKAIIREFGKKDFNDIFKIFNVIKQEQINKLDRKNGKKGSSINVIIKKIDYVLENKEHLETILNNFQLNEAVIIKDELLSQIHLGSIDSQNTKDEFYHALLGWLIDRSKENWCDKKEAIFTKKDFDDKFNRLRDKHVLVNAIFRNKKDLENTNPINFNEINYNDLYIKQIEDIERNKDDKKDIIKEAIIDFIFRDIEIAHLIKTTNNYTEYDFEEFEKKCMEHWKKIKRKFIVHDLSKYNDDDMNNFAIKIYDEIMNELKIEFQDYFGFNDSNRYIQNGTFLNLSDIPKIGWHPKWEKKYKKNE